MIALRSEPTVIAHDVLVPIPALLILHATAVDLNETHPALHHPPRRQTLLGKMTAVFFVHAIERLDGLRFILDGKCLGSRCLHSVGQLKTLDPRVQFPFNRRSRRRLPIQLRQQIQLRTLPQRAERGWSRQVINRRTRGF